MPIRTAGVIIKNRAGKYLLQLRTHDAPSYKDQWITFGGHSEGEETSLETAVRELKEELDILFEPNRFQYVGDFSFMNESGETILSGIYRLFIRDDEKITLGEGSKYGFFTKDELVAISMPPWMEKLIKKFF